MAILPFSTADRDLWRTFRRIADQVNAAVERDLMAATKLSGADHGILSRLAEAKLTALRQQELATSMQWDRTRLSHHLTRMEQRGLIKRTKIKGVGTSVGITTLGDRARKAADPIHEAAVVRNFVSKLSPEQREAIDSLAASFPPADQTRMKNTRTVGQV